MPSVDSRVGVSPGPKGARVMKLPSSLPDQCIRTSKFGVSLSICSSLPFGCTYISRDTLPMILFVFCV